MLTHRLGFRGPDAEEKMFEMWRQHGAAGDAGETAEQQEKRYVAADPNGRERNPGLNKYVFRDPDIIITTGMDYLVKTWDAKTFDSLQTFEGHVSYVNRARQYHGKWILSASHDGSMRLWRLGREEKGVCERTYWISHFGIWSMELVPGQRAATGHMDNAIRITSLFSGEVLAVVRAHAEIGPWDNYWQKEGAGLPTCLLHLRDNILVSGSDDSTIRFWDVDTMRCLGVHVGHFGFGEEIGGQWKMSQRWSPVWDMIFVGGEGTRIATASYDRTVVIWDVADVENVKRLKSIMCHDNSLMSIAVLEEDVIFTCAADNTFKIWDLKKSEQLQEEDTRGYALVGHRVNSHCCAVGGGDTTIRVYDWQVGEDLLGERGFIAHDCSIYGMGAAFSEETDEGWLEPIMYRVSDPYVQNIEQIYASTHWTSVALQAKNFMGWGEWGETLAKVSARWNPMDEGGLWRDWKKM